MHGARDLLVISGPKEAGDGHARAHGHAFKEADQQKDQRPGRADRRERLITKKPADDQRVRRIIKLLENLAQKHWDREFDDQPPRAALRHIQRISAHSASFPSA